MANPTNPGTFEQWMTRYRTFQDIAPKSGNTGDFESWLTNRLYLEDYVSTPAEAAEVAAGIIGIPACAEGRLRAVLLSPAHEFLIESYFEDARRDFTSLSYVTKVDGWGSFAGAVAWDQSPLAEHMNPNNILVIYRTPPGGEPEYIDFVGIVRRTEIFTTSLDVTLMQIYGREADSIMNRYYIEPVAGLEYNSKTGFADDVIKAYVRDECLLDATKIYPNFSVSPDSSQSATSLSRDIRYGKLSDVIKNIRSSADDFNFKITIADDLGSFLFNTYYPQYGLDRRIGSASPLIFSMDNRNMRMPRYWKRGYDGVTRMIMLGGGQGTDRVVVKVNNANALATWGFHEQTFDDRGEAEANLASVGEGLLLERGPTEGLDFEIIAANYGVEWKLGYKVSAEYAGVEADYIIEQVRVVIGNEQLESPVEAITPDLRLLEIRT